MLSMRRNSELSLVYRKFLKDRQLLNTGVFSVSVVKNLLQDMAVLAVEWADQNVEKVAVLVERRAVLKKIQAKFQRSIHEPGLMERAINEAQALALIELLEIEDCGQYGGHDAENPCVDFAGCDAHLYERFFTVAQKYGDEDLAIPLKKYFVKPSPESQLKVTERHIEAFDLSPRSALTNAGPESGVKRGES